MTHPLAAPLARLQPRERRLVVVALTVIAAVALVTLAEWLWKEQQRVAERLPVARAQLARMQEDTAELLQLNRTPPPAPIALAAAQQAAQAAASARGLELTIAPQNDALTVTGSVAVPALLDWLAALATSQQLRAQSLVLKPESGTDGKMRLEARLVAGQSTPQ